MKLIPRDSRHGLSIFRLALTLAIAALVPLLAYAAAPGWWSHQGVLVQNGTADDYALVNQGQLKNIARAAVTEMDAGLPGGAGNTLHALVDAWASPTAQTNDYAPLNLGQLKNIAKPFYDRLIAAGLAGDYPWSGSSNQPDDFALVNIGQVKKLFSFDVPNPLYDGDGNGLPDAWEQQYFGQTGVDPNADPDNDGLTTLEEFQLGSNPTNASNGFAITPGNNSKFVSQSVPTTMMASHSYPVSVKMLNTGSTTWTQTNTSTPWALAMPNTYPTDSSIWGLVRVPHAGDVLSGQPSNNQFTVTAPATPGTYQFQWVMAQDFVEWFGPLTPNTAIEVVLAPPTTPTDLQAIPLSFTRVDLSWTSIGGTGGKVERKTGAAGTYSQIAVSNNPASFSDTTVLPGTQYFYRIIATNSAGESSYSNEASVTLDLQPQIPSAGMTLWLRSDVGMIKDATDNINTWIDQSGNSNDSVQNNASYQPHWVGNSLNGKPVLRFDGIDDQLASANSLGSNNFTVFAVAKTSNTHEVDGESTSGISGAGGQRYLFGALFPGGAGVSMGTNGISVYEHYPESITALAVYDGSVGSDFSIVTTEYTARQPQIFLNGIPVRTGLLSALATVNAPTQIGSGSYGAFGGDVAEVLIYNAALTDSDRLLVEKYLNEKYGLFLNVPAAPTNLQARAISSSQIDLVWTKDSASVVSFILERKVGTSGTFAEIGTVNSRLTSYVDSGLTEGLQYFYRVRATNLAGGSDPSNIADATTLSDVPPVAFSGLSAWLRSDAGIVKDGSDRVTTWTDQVNAAGNGNSAKQANGDAQPIWIDAALYNKPVLQFDGVNDQLVAATSAGTNNFTVFVVAQPTEPHEIDAESPSGIGGGSGQHYLLGATWRGSDTGAGLSMGTNGLSVYEHGSDIITALAVDNETINDYTVATVRYTSKQPQIYVNGLLRRTGVISPNANTYAPVEIGSGSYGAFNGRVAEVLIYNTALSDNDRRGVEDYLARKYGFFDSDNDGLTDAEEAQYGTDPYNADTNGDGILDGTAIALGISATSLDTDGDGLTNAQELVMGTDPLRVDTDRDGVPDAQDAYPLDPSRWEAPPIDPNDHTAPTITLTEPVNAILLP